MLAPKLVISVALAVGIPVATTAQSGNTRTMMLDVREATILSASGG